MSDVADRMVPEFLAMSDEIVRLREQLAEVEEQLRLANIDWANCAAAAADHRAEADALRHRAERAERVVQMLRIASVLPSPDLLTDGDWADLCDAVRALDAEAQP